MQINQLDRYQQLASLGSFSRESLLRELNLPTGTVATLIDTYLSRGYIKRVRQDFYVVVSLEKPGQTILSRYQIACRQADDATLINHTAFEIYGSYNQVYYEVYIATKSSLRDFSFDGVRYRFFKPQDGAKITTRDGLRLTTLEQTVIDSIHNLDKLMGLEEVINCIDGVPPLQPEELLAVLVNYDNGFLYQKTGFILESLNQNLHLPETFFAECQKHLPARRNYLTDNADIFSARWGLYTPDIKAILNQGTDEDFNG